MLRSQFDELLGDLAPQALADPAQAFARSGVDSLGVIEILVTAEETFGVRFDEATLGDGSELSPDSLFSATAALAAAAQSDQIALRSEARR